MSISSSGCRANAMPLVSICMPLFNGEPFLEAALHSAFAQTYPSLELVVSDDDSRDGTIAIVQRLAAEAPMPVKILFHVPSGIGANWNNCVRHARGEYIKFLFQDDLLMPDCVARMVAMARSDHGVGLVYCRRRILHDANNAGQAAWVKDYGTVHRSWAATEIAEGVMPGRRLLGDPALLERPRNKIGEPTAVLLHRSVFIRAGLFDENMRQALDYAYWYKVLRHFKIGFVDDELVAFRLHPAQATQVNARSHYGAEYERLPHYYLRHLGRHLHPKVLRTILLRETYIGRRIVSLAQKLRLYPRP